MAKEKKVIFEEINMVEDTPDDLVMELFTEAFWPDHPLGRPILGHASAASRASSATSSPPSSRSVYHPGNILIAAAGHLDHRRPRAPRRSATSGRSRRASRRKAARAAAPTPAARS